MANNVQSLEIIGTISDSSTRDRHSWISLSNSNAPHKMVVAKKKKKIYIQ